MRLSRVLLAVSSIVVPSQASLAADTEHHHEHGGGAPHHAGHAPATHAARHAPVRHAPVRHAPVGHASVGHAPVRHAPVRHVPVRHAAVVPPPPAPIVKPAPPPPPPVGTVTGLPLPRFASFRSEEVNMRSGPGTRYPIQWVYKRRDLPIEIEREFDVWRLVETQDGTKGWVHQATLIGNRTFVTLPLATPAAAGLAASGLAGAGPAAAADGSLATTQTVRATAAADGAPVAYLKPGVIGHVQACPAASDWCRVSAGSVTGFLRRDAMWGLLPGEVVATH